MTQDTRTPGNKAVVLILEAEGHQLMLEEPTWASHRYRVDCSSELYCLGDTAHGSHAGGHAVGRVGGTGARGHVMGSYTQAKAQRHSCDLIQAWRRCSYTRSDLGRS